MSQDSILEIFSSIMSFVFLFSVFFFKFKGKLKELFDYFPDRTYFYKLNARLELVEMNLSTLQRLVMKYHDVVSQDIKPSGKDIAIQQMKQTQRH